MYRTFLGRSIRILMPALIRTPDIEYHCVRIEHIPGRLLESESEAGIAGCLLHEEVGCRRDAQLRRHHQAAVRDEPLHLCSRPMVYSYTTTQHTQSNRTWMHMRCEYDNYGRQFMAITHGPDVHCRPGGGGCAWGHHPAVQTTDRLRVEDTTPAARTQSADWEPV